MRKPIIYICLLLCVAVSSCKQDAATLTLQVSPMWGSSALAMNTPYSTPDGKYLKFTTNKMFLSHIRLVKADNTEVEVNAAAFIDYSMSNTITLSAVNGNYTGIRFGIGLDTAQNHTDPAVNSTDPTLGAAPGMWWDASRYHLFADIEGHSGTTSSTTSIFFYHIGLDSFYRTATVSKGFSVSSGANTTLQMNADFQKLFYGGVTAVDVIAEPYTHSNDAVNTAKKMADGCTQMFTLQ